MKAIRKSRKEKGFTIIELVVVILLLGILAATALPRFINVSGQAHASVFQSTFGGFSTGVSMFRAQYIANGEPVSVALEGQSLTFNRFGYPTLGDVYTLPPVSTTAQNCMQIYNAVLQSGRPTVGIDAASTSLSASPAQNDVNFDLNTDFAVAVLDGTADSATAPAFTGDYESPECYFIYIGQYTSHEAAEEAGEAGLPFFTYNAYGEIEVGNTSTFAP